MLLLGACQTGQERCAVSDFEPVTLRLNPSDIERPKSPPFSNADRETRVSNYFASNEEADYRQETREQCYLSHKG